MTANMILLFVNLLWIFIAIWSAWGLLPILVIGAVLNHLITRLEYSRRQRGEGLGTPADSI